MCESGIYELDALERPDGDDDAKDECPERGEESQADTTAQLHAVCPIIVALLQASEHKAEDTSGE